jgi:hypothetical protein
MYINNSIRRWGSWRKRGRGWAGGEGGTGAGGEGGLGQGKKDRAGRGV